MIVLGYVGDHAKDTLPVQAGWAITRASQRGPYRQVTHTESVLKGDNYKLCTIASSSVRDGGVRVKEDVTLAKGNWMAVDVPGWDVWLAVLWFVAHLGCKYDWIGAIATRIFWLRGSLDKFFCNQATGAPFIKTADQYAPCQFMAIALSMPGRGFALMNFSETKKYD